MDRKRIRIVLVEPRGAGNVGSVARAMSNTGLTDLYLVRPAPYLNDEAYMMAVSARPILERALVYDTTEEAVAGTGLTIGTTRRTGRERRAGLTPHEMAARLSEETRANAVAVLFGNEERGLDNRDLALCHWVVRIPSHPDYPSLNLAQAVMILCYEIYCADLPLEAEPPQSRASIEEQEAMYRSLEEILLQIGFLHPDNPFRIMWVLRKLFARAGLTEREVRILRGICRQMKWYASVGCREGAKSLPHQS